MFRDLLRDMVRRTVHGSAVLLLLGGVAVATPGSVGYQALLLDPTGTPINGTVAIDVGLWTDATSTAPADLLYTESHPAVPVTDGALAISLGDGQSPSAAFDASLLDQPALWLELEIDGETLAPRQALESAPYALLSERAATADALGALAPGDVVTGVTAGSGLSGGGDGGALTLSIDTSTTQSRVGGSCGVGESIRVINANGSVVCESDTNTTYGAGFGLTLGGTTFSANTNVLQRRVSATCPPGQSIRVITATGGVTCEVDTDTNVLAGFALDQVGTRFDVDPTELNGSEPMERAFNIGSVTVNIGNTVTLGSITTNSPDSGDRGLIGSASVRCVSASCGPLGSASGILFWDTNQAGPADGPAASWRVSQSGDERVLVVPDMRPEGGGQRTWYLRGSCSAGGDSCRYENINMVSWFAPD